MATKFRHIMNLAVMMILHFQRCLLLIASLGNVNPVANDLVDGGLSKLFRYKLKFLTVG